MREIAWGAAIILEGIAVGERQPNRRVEKAGKIIRGSTRVLNEQFEGKAGIVQRGSQATHAIHR